MFDEKAYQKQYQSLWYQENKEKVKARSDRRYRDKKEDIKKKQEERKPEKQAYMKEYGKSYYQENKEKVLEKQKLNRLKDPEKQKMRGRKFELKKIGWSLESYEQAFKEQQGLCAICKQPAQRSTGVLDSDHEHVEPPKPRGLLCHLCNLGIGAFKDDPIRLQEAINYLRKYSDAQKKDNGSS
jgi:hypothetical protein